MNKSESPLLRARDFWFVFQLTPSHPPVGMNSSLSLKFAKNQVLIFQSSRSGWMNISRAVRTPHLGFSWVSICWMMLSIQAIRSRAMLKKRNFSAVSTSCARRPSEASSRPFQASITSLAVAWIAFALSPAYWACSRDAISWNSWTWREDDSVNRCYFNETLQCFKGGITHV